MSRKSITPQAVEKLTSYYNDSRSSAIIALILKGYTISNILWKQLENDDVNYAISILEKMQDKSYFAMRKRLLTIIIKKNRSKFSFLLELTKDSKKLQAHACKIFEEVKNK